MSERQRPSEEPAKFFVHGNIDTPLQEVKDDREPFVLRGHHLDNFSRLLKFPLGFISAGLLAKIEKKAFVEARDNAEKGHVSRRKKGKITPKEVLLYVNDLIGSAPEEAAEREKKVKGVFDKFRKMPDDYPVKLVSEQKDEICKICVVGKHCMTKDQSIIGRKKPLPVDDIVDISHLNMFLNQAKSMGIERQEFKFIEEWSIYSDVEPERTVSILTTAGVLRKVLKATPRSAFKEVNDLITERGKQERAQSEKEQS